MKKYYLYSSYQDVNNKSKAIDQCEAPNDERAQVFQSVVDDLNGTESVLADENGKVI